MSDKDVIDLGSVVIVLLSGLLGMWVHWMTINKKGRTGLPEHFYQYLFTDNPNNGKMQIVIFASTMAGLYSIGTFDLVNYTYFMEALRAGELFKPAVSGIITAIGAGYICDSAGSKGTGATTAEAGEPK